MMAGTPMVLQFPSRVPPGQTLPPSTLVTSLDIVPTALDAAGLLAHPPHPPDDPNALPYNAGKRLDGRSLLPLLSGGHGYESPDALSIDPPYWWRDSIFSELGVAATVKHRSGWQLVALHMPDEFQMTTDGGLSGLASEVVACEYERLRTGPTWERSFTHARHCVWRDTNNSLSTNLIGEGRVRFDSNERYQNYHSVEQLIHWTTDLGMAHDYKTRCPRQLACLQGMLREHTSARVHFDGDPNPFGEYTWSEERWRTFSLGGCDPEVLTLPPEHCNQGMPVERSVMSCDELREEHAPTEVEAEEEAEEEEIWTREPHRPPMCASSGRDCLESRCCADAGEHCFGTLLGTAHCKAFCRQDDTWACNVLQMAPPPPPPAARPPVALPAARWQRPRVGAICAETLQRDTGSGRLFCPAPMVHRDARQMCRAQGARLCTKRELLSDVALRDPCGLAEDRVWTGEFCSTGDKHYVSIGGSSVVAPEEEAAGRHAAIAEECMHGDDALLPAICCADAALPPAPPTLPADAPQYPPPPEPPVGPSPAPPDEPCVGNFQNCYISGCCITAGYKCFQKYSHVQYAQCRPTCPAEWECIERTRESVRAAAATHVVAQVATAHVVAQVATTSPPVPPSTSTPAIDPGDNSAYQPPAPDSYVPGTPAHELVNDGHPWPTTTQTSLDDQVKHDAAARDAALQGKELRFAIFAVCAASVVILCACAVACIASRRAERTQQAQGFASSVSARLKSARLKVDLRARSSSGRVPAAYIQMAGVVPTEERQGLVEVEDFPSPTARMAV